MGLFFPKALTIRKFEGGLKLDSDYTDLGDTETNDAQNCLYGPDGDITQRKGSARILNTRLTSNGSSAVRPITGHHYFRSLGSTSVSIWSDAVTLLMTFVKHRQRLFSQD